MMILVLFLLVSLPLLFSSASGIFSLDKLSCAVLVKWQLSLSFLLSLQANERQLIPHMYVERSKTFQSVSVPGDFLSLSPPPLPSATSVAEVLNPFHLRPILKTRGHPATHQHVRGVWVIAFLGVDTAIFSL